VNAIDQLVIKDGKHGSKLYTKSEWHEKEAFPVIPVDTVGAGDGYDAGYIYGHLNGLSIDERLAFANGQLVRGMVMMPVIFTDTLMVYQLMIDWHSQMA